MAALSTLAAITSIGTAAYGLYSSEQAKSEARSEKKKQEGISEGFRKEEAERLNIEKATTERDAARKRQRQIASGSSGRSSTILTGKTDSVGSVGRKPLLGT